MTTARPSVVKAKPTCRQTRSLSIPAQGISKSTPADPSFDASPSSAHHTVHMRFPPTGIRACHGFPADGYTSGDSAVATEAIHNLPGSGPTARDAATSFQGVAADPLRRPAAKTCPSAAGIASVGPFRTIRGSAPAVLVASPPFHRPASDRGRYPTTCMRSSVAEAPAIQFATATRNLTDATAPFRLPPPQRLTSLTVHKRHARIAR